MSARPADPARGPGTPDAGRGSRGRPGETLAILCWLAGDLLSIPFHVLKFLCTRARHRREFQRALKDAAP